jgi:hypothetical protein
MHTKTSTGKIPQTYEFIKAHRKRFNVRTMCRVLEVAPSGYYAWLQEPVCQRALEDVRLLRLVRASYAASHGIYGAPRVFLDLWEAGETCSKRRIIGAPISPAPINASFLIMLVYIDDVFGPAHRAAMRNRTDAGRAHAQRVLLQHSRTGCSRSPPSLTTLTEVALG